MQNFLGIHQTLKKLIQIEAGYVSRSVVLLNKYQ
jgi:hypothetical protein